MASIEPLRALHYNLEVTDGLQNVVAPPYDVIDADARAELAARSPYNVVRIDLPQGNDPYATAAAELTDWRIEGAVVRDPEPSMWALAQMYTGPDGRRRTRHGILARVRIEEYGAGRIRPHERTHPGPKEDRLRLTRATKVNLSPIFALFSDPDSSAWDALAAAPDATPWGEARDADGTINRVWRIADRDAISLVQAAAADAELLIADGHHRYETARVYAEDIGGEGPHRYVLMCLVALEDPGLTVFPTHRLVRGLTPEQHRALDDAIERDFEREPLDDADELEPTGESDAVRIGYIDAVSQQPYRLTLADQSIADAALADHAAPYRRLDTAVLEALILKRALGMTDDDIDHLTGLGYARDRAQALELVRSGEYDAAFFMGATPVARIQEVAAAGETMPPKSTYFFPKVPTGLVFNELVR
jgi:uncharacterized protein (DUF1015 family)